MSDLRTLALAATPGPWSYLIDDYENGTMFLTNDPKHEQHPIARDLVTHDAAYIAAASPAVVLALLDVYEAARAFADAFMSYMWTSYDREGFMADAMKKQDALRAALAHVSEVMGE